MYLLEDNMLKKKVYYGTGWIGEVIDKMRDPAKDFIEVEFEVDYGKNHLSKLIVSAFIFLNFLTTHS